MGNMIAPCNMKHLFHLHIAEQTSTELFKRAYKKDEWIREIVIHNPNEADCLPAAAPPAVEAAAESALEVAAPDAPLREFVVDGDNGVPTIMYQL